MRQLARTVSIGQDVDFWMNQGVMYGRDKATSTNLMRGNSVWIMQENKNAKRLDDDFLGRINKEILYGEIHDIFKEKSVDVEEAAFDSIN